MQEDRNMREAELNERELAAVSGGSSSMAQRICGGRNTRKAYSGGCYCSGGEEQLTEYLAHHQGIDKWTLCPFLKFS